MGSQQKVNLRRAQRDAYVAVLKALASKKLDWSKRKLLADLRKHLNVSQDEYLGALDEVLKDPEVTAIRTGCPVPHQEANPDPPTGPKCTRVFQAPSPAPPTRSIPGNPGPSGLEQDHTRKSNAFVCSHPKEKLTWRAEGAQGPPSGFHATDMHSGMMAVDKMVGKKVERFRTVPDSGWVHAVITDYDVKKDLHCLVYNFNIVGRETWEWISLSAELENRRLHILPGLPIDLKSVVPSAILKPEERLYEGQPHRAQNVHGQKPMQWVVPFEYSKFTKCLERSGVAELEGMLNAVVARQQHLLDQLISTGSPALEQEDPLVKALVEQEILRRREAALLKEGKDLQSLDSMVL